MASKCSLDDKGRLVVEFDTADEALVAIINKDRNPDGPGVYYTLNGNKMTMHDIPTKAGNDDRAPDVGGMEASM